MLTEETIDPYKGLPRRLDIGYLTFRITVTTPELSKGFLDDNWGCCDFQNHRIYVDSTLSMQHAFNTVLHEVKHAIHFVQGLNEESSEEDFTNRGTNGQIEVWMRNPRFYTWQTKTLRILKSEARRG